MNFPPLPAAEVKGTRVVPQGYRIDTSYGCEPHLSPSGRRATPGSDAEVNLDGYISVTPMRADLTAHDALDRLKDAFA